MTCDIKEVEPTEMRLVRHPLGTCGHIKLMSRQEPLNPMWLFYGESYFNSEELRQIADILDRRNNPAQKEGEVKGYE